MHNFFPTSVTRKSRKLRERHTGRKEDRKEGRRQKPFSICPSVVQQDRRHGFGEGRESVLGRPRTEGGGKSLF